MEEDKVILGERVLTHILHLNAKLCGIVTGLLCGVSLFLATNWLVLKAGVDVGAHLSLLNQYLPGYRVTFAGSLIGFAYGLVCGFVVGYFFSKTYNWLANWKESKVRATTERG